MNEEGQSKKQFKCSKYDKVHGKRECPVYGKSCYKCGRTNHFSNVCRAKMRRAQDVTKEEKSESEDDDFYVSSIVKVGELSKTSKSIWKELIQVNGKAIMFKIDTGSEINIISLKTYKLLSNEKKQMQRSHTILQAYSGTRISPIGKVNLSVEIRIRNLGILCH